MGGGLRLGIEKPGIRKESDRRWGTKKEERNKGVEEGKKEIRYREGEEGNCRERVLARKGGKGRGNGKSGVQGRKVREKEW